MNVKIQQDWHNLLEPEFQKPYFSQLTTTIREKIASGATVYPPGKLIFNAFELTPPQQVKAVILGQDPYHNPGEAMGLCFSVPRGITVPPSLRNIFKELKTDLGIDPPNHGDLTSWAKHGVLLLNSILTVERNKAGSHQQLGWQEFTDAVIQKISEYSRCAVFILWGAYAKTKVPLIDAEKHLIISAAHPSPLARGAFFGHRPFSHTNNYLKENNIAPIDWAIRD